MASLGRGLRRQAGWVQTPGTCIVYGQAQCPPGRCLSFGNDRMLGNDKACCFPDLLCAEQTWVGTVTYRGSGRPRGALVTPWSWSSL